MSARVSRRKVGGWGIAAMLAAAGVVAAGAALAQGFPTKPIRIIVPFPPGNASDVAARLISVQLAERLATPVVIENKTGASGVIGVQAVKSAEPDGTRCC